MLMFDSLNRLALPQYGGEGSLPNFARLAQKTVRFDTFYGGSMPCMPAREELHTGRYNFLHHSWSPLQPFDDSVIEHLREAGVYTHIATDHFHYWEDGGSGFLQRYDSCEMVRGQQGDPWKAQVAWPDTPPTLSGRCKGQNWRHDWINRSFLDSEAKMPQNRVVDNGLDFLRRSAGEDNWFLTMELFDPHEPFFTQPLWRAMQNDPYSGKNMDWPDYGPNRYTQDTTRHLRSLYRALVQMCDASLGRVLDQMDALDLWKDTMLIVNTDHGFLLGEHGEMGKNTQPFYEEVIHLPFFIHDPRCPDGGSCRDVLAQTVDIAPTLAEYFGARPLCSPDGRSLLPALREGAAVRGGALFGIHGGHVGVTDGRWAYLRAAAHRENTPLCEYTLMPAHMNSRFTAEELQGASLCTEFRFAHHVPMLRVPCRAIFNTFSYGTLLYDLESDPGQCRPVRDDAQESRLLRLMKTLMQKNEAPAEQYARLGIG